MDPQLLVEMAKRSKELGALDSQLSERIVETVKLLRQHVSVPIDTVFDENTDLVFCKSDGKWCLVLVTDDKETPLLSATREDRVRVFEENLIEQLIRDGLVQLEEMVEQRKSALCKADEILEALKVAA